MHCNVINCIDLVPLCMHAHTVSPNVQGPECIYIIAAKNAISLLTGSMYVVMWESHWIKRLDPTLGYFVTVYKNWKAQSTFFV